MWLCAGRSAGTVQVWLFAGRSATVLFGLLNQHLQGCTLHQYEAVETAACERHRLLIAMSTWKQHQTAARLRQTNEGYRGWLWERMVLRWVGWEKCDFVADLYGTSTLPLCGTINRLWHRPLNVDVSLPQTVRYTHTPWSLYVPHSGHYMYRTMVTICTPQWSLYVPHSSHYMYHQFNIQQFYVLPT